MSHPFFGEPLRHSKISRWLLNNVQFPKVYLRAAAIDAYGFLTLHADLGTSKKHEEVEIDIRSEDFDELARAMIVADKRRALVAFAKAIQSMPYLSDHGSDH